jgi:uncharacterized membrane protein
MNDLASVFAAVEGEQRIVLHPNRSFTARGACMLLGGTFFFGALLIGISLAIGAWPVAPFLGAEFVVVAAMLAVLRCHAEDREVIHLTEQTLFIESFCGRRHARHEFPRYWTAVDVTREGAGVGMPRVFVRLHDRRVEVGAQLTEAGRLDLAHILSCVLGPGRHGLLRPPRSGLPDEPFEKT